jgi:hypothetical protein
MEGRMSRLVVAAALAAVLGRGAALPPQPYVQIVGAGLATCGRWTRDINDVPMHDVEEGWVLGFISGAGLGIGHSLLANIDGYAIAGWIDNYCHAHPLDSIGGAAIALAEALEAKWAAHR